MDPVVLRMCARVVPPPSPVCIPSGCSFFTALRMLGCCVLSAAVAGASAGGVSAFVEPIGWCVGAVLVAGGTVCASAAPSSWRIGAVLVVAGVI